MDPPPRTLRFFEFALTDFGLDLMVAEKICENGFAALSSLDAGYYGKGIYFTSSVLYTLPYMASRAMYVPAPPCIHPPRPRFNSGFGFTLSHPPHTHISHNLDSLPDFDSLQIRAPHLPFLRPVSPDLLISSPSIIFSWVIPGHIFPVTEHHKGPKSLLGSAIKNGFNSHYVLTTSDGSVISDRTDQFYDELVNPDPSHLTSRPFLDWLPPSGMAQASPFLLD